MRNLFIYNRITTRLKGYQYSSRANMSSHKIAVCQMTSVADKEANLKVVRELVQKAAKDQAKMIFFPEACDYMAENKADIVKLSEPLLTGNTVNEYRQLASKHNVWLSMGGLHEKDEKDPTKVFNTHLLIDAKGSLVQTYRKLHLFDVEIPEQNIRLKESDFCLPGDQAVCPQDTDIGKIGMAICYDMRFPELSTLLRSLNANILTYPSAFTYATGEAHWELLLRTRAIENQCYVIAAAQVGQHNAKRRSYGHALVVSPWGKILADCGEESPAYRIVEISFSEVGEVRKKMPVFQHRRIDVYSLQALCLRKDLLPEHSVSSHTLDASGNQTLNQDEPSYVFGHVRVPESCVFYKSKWTYAFVNLRCVIPGHVLVAPLRQALRNEDLSSEEAADFFETVRRVQKLMEKVHSTQSCTVTIQDGPAAGQTVKHVHCHVMPRKKGDFIETDLIYLELAKHDQYKMGTPCKPPRSRKEMDEEAEFLRKEIQTLEKSSPI